ncbi:MAG TPA: SDR family oxidoreductase [Acetobacteraceae bacterium]|nr:SDR family oxidoreductase [Acetobacteraceae bacterium]
MADPARFATYPSLRGQRVFISGGASGIGESLVAHFAAQGAYVGFLDIADAPAKEVCAKVKAAGHPEPAYRHADVRDVAAFQAVIRELATEVGPFTVLLNNAAHDQRHPWQEVTAEYWDDRVAVNLRHQFFAIQAIAPMMQAAAGGSIINFGSCSWHIGQGGMPAYTSSKAAVEGLTRGMARDLGPDHIRVNCIIPGWIMTERQISLWLTPEAEADLMRNQCLKEKVYPPDIARMALFLASDDSRMCTNQTFVVDGGWI